ncbi:MAG: NUDIX hydrolase [Acidimicrobiales bacterium]|nr:NUDIX hydrolase [Acidimicrobiales bacterium]
MTPEPSHDPSAYPEFAVTADLIVFTIRDGRFKVLLVERGQPPFLGRWALPGGFLREDESAEDAAHRELAEETGLDLSVAHLEQLATFSDPNRDPRQRVVTVAFWAILPHLGRVRGGTDAARAEWFDVAEVEAAIADLEDQPGGHLAFDHDEILTTALTRARDKLEYTTLAVKFCPDEFTLTDLRLVYEAIWNVPVDPRNFVRKIKGAITPLEEATHGAGDGTWSEPEASKAWSMQLLEQRQRPTTFDASPANQAPTLHADAESTAPPVRRGRRPSFYSWSGKEVLSPPFKRPGPKNEV